MPVSVSWYLFSRKILSSCRGVFLRMKESFSPIRVWSRSLFDARENKDGTIPILLRYMKIKEDLAGQYYEQVRPIMTSEGTVSMDMQRKYLDQALKVITPTESPSAEKIFNYSLARKVS